MGKAANKQEKTPRKADTVAKVYTHIRSLAVSFRLRPGERVREGQLAERFGISRTPVREALNRLVTEGLFTFEPNRGFFCREISLSEISELYEIRAALEVWVFRQVCEKADQADIEKICQSWEKKVKRGSSSETLAQLDQDFHRSIALLAGNDQLLRMLDGVNSRILFFREADLEDPLRKGTTLDEHHVITEALRSREAVTGVQYLEAHILKSAEHAIDVAKEKIRKYRDENE